jgi:hypothetical protein
MMKLNNLLFHASSTNMALCAVAPETRTEHGCKGFGLCVSVSAAFALVRLRLDYFKNYISR